MHYLWLIIAVVAETLGTTAVQASHQFTRLWPSVAAVVFYMISFYCMSLASKVMPVGIVYAFWAGLGIVLIALIGVVPFAQLLALPAAVALAPLTPANLGTRRAPDPLAAGSMNKVAGLGLERHFGVDARGLQQLQGTGAGASGRDGDIGQTGQVGQADPGFRSQRVCA